MFKKGQPKLPGSGIKKGTKHAECKTNVQKRIVRDLVEAAYEGQTVPERIIEIVRTFKDKNVELDVLIDLMPYCYPKLQAVEVEAQAAVDVSDNVHALVELLEKMNADR